MNYIIKNRDRKKLIEELQSIAKWLKQNKSETIEIDKAYQFMIQSLNACSNVLLNLKKLETMTEIKKVIKK